MDNAYHLEKDNGNTYREDAILKEMNNLRVAFNILNGDSKIPPVHQFMRCHMIFDIMINIFKRKARYVAGANMTEPPSYITYAIVISRASICITLTMAALNDPDVFKSDAQNAYFKEPMTKNIYTKCGPEFGADSENRAIIVSVIYRLKSAVSAFRNYLAQCISDLG